MASPRFVRGALPAGPAVVEARDHYRNLWLCVSAFNVAAQRFYARHGFERVATLAGLLRDGDDELLMRKRLAR